MTEDLDLDTILDDLEMALERKRVFAIDFYAPYAKQEEFHANGASKRERLLRAGNQEGKTWAGAAETAYHLTGKYPPWWKGRRFTHPTKGWVAGEGAVLVRDGPQQLLCGTPGVLSDFGTGFIPKNEFVDKPSLSRGVTDAYDTIQVRHYTNGVFDGISTLTFKSYEQGRQKFQTATLDFVWCDEEPPEDIYDECLARVAATAGFVFITFTPLKGMSNVVTRFLTEQSPDRSDTVMTIYDAKHIPEAEREKIINSFPPHQRQARAFGVPMMGSGQVFPIDPDGITEDDLAYVPPHWAKLWGIDFGIAHPFGAVLIAWDKDADVIHVLHSIRMSDALPLQHSAAMKAVAGNIRVAWPQDGTQRRDDGKPLSDQYKIQGLRMMASHATFPDGSISTEAGISEMHDRMTTGRFKVARSLMMGNWGEEFRMYHRDADGMLVKVKDDLMSATRIAVMAKRFAQPGVYGPSHGQPRREETRPIADGVDFDVFS